MDQTDIHVPDESSQHLEPVRFDIKTLLALTLVCAVSVVLVDHFSIVATVALFVFSAIASLWFWANPHLVFQRFWFQAIWGIMMPLACIVTDPFIFVGRDDPVMMMEQVTIASIPRTSMACYGFIFWQMAMLMASWFVTSDNPRCAAFLTGTLLAGMLFAALIGTLLVVPALMFSLIVVGLPGLTPLFTMRVFYSAYKYCKIAAGFDDKKEQGYALSAIGFVAAATSGFCGYSIWPLLARIASKSA